MPKISWVIGQTQAFRNRVLASLLEGSLGSSQVPHFIAIVPTRRRKRLLIDFLKTSFSQKNQKIWLPQIFLISELAEAIDRQQLDLQKGCRLIPETSQGICIEESIQRLGNELEFFQNLAFSKKGFEVSRFPGVVRQLRRFIGFLKQNDLDQDFMERLILDDQGNAQPKDHDLTRIFHTYSNILDEAKFFDSEDRLLRIAETLEEKKSLPGFESCSVLVLDNLTFVSRLEERFLRALSVCFRQIIFSLDFDAPVAEMLGEMEEGRDHIERLSHRYFFSLKPLLQFFADPQQFEQETICSQANEEAIHPTAFSLFRNRILQIRKDLPKHASRIRVLSLHNRVEEVEFICRQLKKNFRKDVPLKRMQVVFPKIEPYISIIYEIFPQYGIPFSITRGLALNSSPIAIVIRSILDIPQRYDREDLFRFFSSNLVTFRREIDTTDFEEFLKRYRIGEHSSLMNHEEILKRFEDFKSEQAARGVSSMHFDVATLDRYCRSANVKGGIDLFEDWFLPLDRAYFSTRYRGGLENREEAERVKRNYFLILRQLYFLHYAQEDFDPLRVAEDPEKVLVLMRLLIRHYQVPGNINRRIQELPDLSVKDRMLLLRRDISALYKVFEIIDGIFEVAVIHKKIREREPLERPLEFTTRLLSETFSESFIVDPMDPHVVSITETLEVRGADFDYVFFGGLTADDYPRQRPLDFILPDTPNAKFRVLNYQDESRYLFSYILRNTKEEACLTYPRIDQDDELERSPFIEDIIALDPQCEETYEKDDKFIASHAELEKHLAREIRLEVGSWRPECGLFLGKVHSPEKTQHQIEVELSRRSSQTLGPYDGILEHFRWLDFVEGPEPVYSVSQLERFAACPQNYLYSRVFGLEPLDEVTEEMEADEFGSYVHEILELFYKTWAKKGEGKINDQNFGNALSIMANCGDQILKGRQKNIEYILWDRQKIKMLSGLEDKDSVENMAPGILRAFLEYEREHQGQPFHPREFEKKFGFGSDEVRIADIRLRGKIDRIDTVELADRGSSKSTTGYMLFDYKTGFVPEGKRVFQGLSFQLPVYLLVLSQMDPKAPLGAAYYHLRDASAVDLEGEFMDPEFYQHGFFGRHKGSGKTQKVFSELMARQVQDWMGSIHRQIQQGQFHYAFEEVRCGFCDYRNICRRDEKRLQSLENIGSTPFYIPERNQREFKALLRFSNLVDEVDDLIERKKMKPGGRLGSKQARVPSELQHLYGHLSTHWQERFRVRFQNALAQWQEVIGATKPRETQ